MLNRLTLKGCNCFWNCFGQELNEWEIILNLEFFFPSTLTGFSNKSTYHPPTAAVMRNNIRQQKHSDYGHFRCQDYLSQYLHAKSVPLTNISKWLGELCEQQFRL